MNSMLRMWTTRKKAIVSKNKSFSDEPLAKHILNNTDPLLLRFIKEIHLSFTLAGPTKTNKIVKN